MTITPERRAATLGFILTIGVCGIIAVVWIAMHRSKPDFGNWHNCTALQSSVPADPKKLSAGMVQVVEFTCDEGVVRILGEINAPQLKDF